MQGLQALAQSQGSGTAFGFRTGAENLQIASRSPSGILGKGRDGGCSRKSLAPGPKECVSRCQLSCGIPTPLCPTRGGGVLRAGVGTHSRDTAQHPSVRGLGHYLRTHPKHHLCFVQHWREPYPRRFSTSKILHIISTNQQGEISSTIGQCKRCQAKDSHKAPPTWTPPRRSQPEGLN